MEMVLDYKKPTHGQLNAMDRLSDLPDSIIHHIISFLGTEESCRTCVLSKRWSHIWSTGLILEFKSRFCVTKKKSAYDDEDGYDSVKSTDLNSNDTSERLKNFIETTMRRYSEKNLSIRKLTLECPVIGEDMAESMDRWLGVAVQNRVEVLSLSINSECPPSYELPAIMFLAKSLVSMTCCRVRVPYCKTLKLVSLQSLDLSDLDIDEDTLQNVILSCPLKKLALRNCSGIMNITIPRCSKLETLNVNETIPEGGTIGVNTSCFRSFTYVACYEDDTWHIALSPAATENLRMLRVFHVAFADQVVDKLATALSSIKIMRFYNCVMPKNVRIVSQTLEEFGINECCELKNVAIEAPKLDVFCYTGDLSLSSVINNHGKCNAYIHLLLYDLNTRAFIRIKKLLKRSNCCKVLSIILNDVSEIEFDKYQVSEIHDGSPYDVPELKLSVFCSTLAMSSCRALIDGLFWSCRPHILSFSNTLSSDNTVIRTLLHILEKKANCWKHPLKRIEVEGTDCSSTFRKWDFDLRLRLYW